MSNPMTPAISEAMVEARKPRPWGIQTIGDMYAPGCHAGMPDGRWVAAVGVPYYTMGFERLRAAWWVLTGRAHAVIWPEAGDLEDIFHPRSKP
jgi:hypothetical protein